MIILDNPYFSVFRNLTIFVSLNLAVKVEKVEKPYPTFYSTRIQDRQHVWQL